jgi:nucleoside-triphosphatase THEP1
VELGLRTIQPDTATVIVISGWREVGKTTLCRELVEMGRAQRLDIAGLLSPARFAANSDAGKPLVKTGIEVEDLRTGQRRLLASSLENELHGSQLGRWTFDDPVMVWGSEVLKNATPCDMLVIDELGPFEFDLKQGWSIGFELIDRQDYRLAVIVIRPEYLEQFQQRWPEATEISLTESTDTTSVAMQIIARVWGNIL